MAAARRHGHGRVGNTEEGAGTGREIKHVLMGVPGFGATTQHALHWKSCWEVQRRVTQEDHSMASRARVSGFIINCPSPRDRVSQRQDSDIWGWVLLGGGGCPVGCRQFNGVSGFSPPEARSIPPLPSSDNQNTPRRCPVSPGHGGVGGRVGKRNQTPVENHCSEGVSL